MIKELLTIMLFIIALPVIAPIMFICAFIGAFS